MRDTKTRTLLVSIACILLLWEGASVAAGSEQLLPGPLRTLKSTALLFCNPAFLKVVGSTLLRGFSGFVIAASAALALGVASGLYNTVRAFVQPWVVVMRSTPVVAFVLLVIVWFSSDAVPVIIAVLVMFPLIYLNVVEGIRSIDGKIVGMARFYGLRGWRLLREVYLPSVRPFLSSGLSNAVGTGWRAIVVGEVLSQPQWGIGAVMRSAQTFLQVDVLIAWTLITVLIGALSEKLVSYVCRPE